MTTYAIFPPGERLSWPNAEPGTAVASLLASKEKVFALQRKFGEGELFLPCVLAPCRV